MSLIKSLGLGHDTNGPVEQIKVYVSDKLLPYLPITRMMWQIFIELWCNLTDFPQVVPRSIGEVVVLDMISKIQVEEVPKSKIIIGFLSLNELVMLGYDVDSCRMWANRAQACHKAKEKCIESPAMIN